MDRQRRGIQAFAVPSGADQGRVPGQPAGAYDVVQQTAKLEDLYDDVLAASAGKPATDPVALRN